MTEPKTTNPATFPCPKCNGWGSVQSWGEQVPKLCDCCYGTKKVAEERMPTYD